MELTDIQGTVTLANGVAMPYLGLGVWQSRGQDVIDAVTYALDAGYRMIDTAALYKNEDGVGKAVNQHPLGRKNVFITSKVWNSDQGYDNTIKAFHTSLEKLQTDYLDLYLVHWPVKGKYKDTWRALETLYSESKIRAIGVSNFMQHHLEDLFQTANITPMVNQVEFHPYLVQPELWQFCKVHNIQQEAWRPLMQGGIFKISLLKNLADKYKVSVAQLVLRWDLQKGVITIPKSTHKKRIEANGDLFGFEISEDDMRSIDALNKNDRQGPDPDNFDF